MVAGSGVDTIVGVGGITEWVFETTLESGTEDGTFAGGT